jgi:hypothetical protein
MSDPNLEQPPNRALIPREEKNEEESKTMLAIIMGGIGALFIFSIVMAFNYASHTVKPETAASKHPPAVSAPATTGSGGNRS